MDKQPEALRLAKLSEELAADEAMLHCWPWPSLAKLYQEDAAELRRLHASNAELLEALRGLDEAYCRAGTALTRDQRHEDRCRLMAARAAIANATKE